MSDSSLLPRIANGLACAGALSEGLDPDTVPEFTLTCLATRPSQSHQPSSSRVQPIICSCIFITLEAQLWTRASSGVLQIMSQAPGTSREVKEQPTRGKERVHGSSSFPRHRKPGEKADTLSLSQDPAPSGHVPRPSGEAGCQGRSLMSMQPTKPTHFQRRFRRAWVSSYF